MKILAIVDDKHTCECCGKTPIKRAAAIELQCGDVVYYGMTCATKKHLNKSEGQLNAEIKKLRDAEIKRVSAFVKPRNEVKALKSAFMEARRLYRMGPKFAKHVTPFRDAVDRMIDAELGDNIYRIRHSEIM